MIKLKNIKEKISMHPIMSFIVLIFITIILSGLLSIFGVHSSYNRVNTNTLELETVNVEVESLFSLSGLKYIFSNTVSNFVNFAPLSMFLIILIGIGVMERSGFLRSFFTIITKYSSKNKVTFFLILFSLIGSIMGDISYMIILPLGALLFKYGKRNPLAGVIISFAGLSCGSGVNILISSIDSSLLKYSNNAVKLLDANYVISNYAFLFIMLVVTIILSIVLTILTEKFVIPRLDKYESKYEDSVNISKKELKGLIIGLGAGIIYMLFFVYNIIPGLPLSGNLLDYSEVNYIDKLFGYNSFFNSGFVFVITIFFIILGVFYGIGSKNIKSIKDVGDQLSHSLDSFGGTIVLIFLASAFISIFKKTNMGTVFCAILTNLIADSSVSGLVLVFFLLIVSMASTLFLPSSVYKWAILSGSVIPLFMNAGMSAEFSQVIFRAGECISSCLTPLGAYFVIYLGFLHHYNQSDNVIGINQSIRFMVPYAFATLCVWIVVLLLWYFTGFPLGINSYPFI